MKKTCSYPNCLKEGLYPAPFSPQQSRPYKHFCLEHIRLHNASWDFLGGLTEKEIENHIRYATVWERPTWPLGDGPLTRKGNKGTTGGSPQPHVPPEILRMLAVFALKHPVTPEDLKKRYRELVKKHHPDAKNDKPSDIAMFLSIQEAFKTLKKYYASKQ